MGLIELDCCGSFLTLDLTLGFDLAVSDEVFQSNIPITFSTSRAFRGERAQEMTVDR